MRLSFFSGRLIKTTKPADISESGVTDSESRNRQKQRKTRNMSDKVIHLNSSNFDATIASDKPVLVDFWAPWCGPCRMLGPTIDELAETVGDTALVCKLNVDESPDIAQKYGVNQIPTIIFFKNSKRLGASGMATKDALLAKLKAI